MKTKLIAILALALGAFSAVADQKVSDRVTLTSGSLDPAADILPIVDTSAGTSGSKKITVDELFTGWGMTSAGADVAQAANAAAQRTALGLGTAATMTGPSGTIVGTTDAQTLTNKTLTSPVINVGSDATGDVYYRSAGGAFTRLAAGSNGQVLTLAAGVPSWSSAAILTNWGEGISTGSPNGATPAVSLTPSNASSNVDVVILAKGTGAILADVPDNSASGGNKRGGQAVDWQSSRSAASQVASGGNSSIGGGTNNTASGNNSMIGGGDGNTASGVYDAVSGGLGGTASGGYSGIGGGNGNTASGTASRVGGGSNNTASGSHSWMPGGRHGTTRGVYGAGAWASGRFSTTGDAQHGQYLLRTATTNTTTTELSADGASPAAGTRLTLPDNHAYAFRGRLIARSSTGDVAVWTIDGLIKRGAGAAATALVGTPTATQTFADAGATGWTIAITADTTNGSLKIEVTGAAATTIHWVADIETVEVS